jgi:hypothetical protein
VAQFAARAVAAIEAAAPAVTKNRDEFERLRNDMHCIQQMSLSYVEKVRAAMSVLRYGHSGKTEDLADAEVRLSLSLEAYRKLAQSTELTYHFANSMQTSQRRIPVSGGHDGKPANYHWVQLLPIYEKELADLRGQLASAREGREVKTQTLPTLRAADIKLLSSGAETYRLDVGARVFTDSPVSLQSLVPALLGLTGIRFARTKAADAEEVIRFSSDRPVSVLVGYAHTPRSGWREVPQLETDALAGERAGVEPLIENAATIDEVGGVDVYNFNFPAGEHRLEIRGRGAYVVLGVVARP